MIRRTAENRPGIAIILAMIFMMAFLYTGMTAMEWATGGLRESGDVNKSRQALYNTDHAVGKALYLFKNPKRLTEEGYEFSLSGDFYIM